MAASKKKPAAGWSSWRSTRHVSAVRYAEDGSNVAAVCELVGGTPRTGPTDGAPWITFSQLGDRAGTPDVQPGFYVTVAADGQIGVHNPAVFESEYEQV